MQHVNKAEDIVELVHSQTKLRVAGGGTKPATSNSANVSLSRLSGILQYDPSEFTFTALAGTRLDEVQQLLASKQQYLPFDPPLAEAGATLGGTVATGLSGAGRFRYGGVRDFLLGVRFVTCTGDIVSTGSKVVKNAAGFDFPKLMVGSLGQYGIMTELTFKVFPAPQSCATIVLDTDDLGHAFELTKTLATSPFDLACLDIDPSPQIWIRVGGIRDSVQRRAARILRFAGGRGTIVRDQEDINAWHACGEFQWVPEGHDLVKVATIPDKVIELISALNGLSFRICAGGHCIWLAWPSACGPQDLDAMLNKLECPAIALTGDWPNPWIGVHRGGAFHRLLVKALDPKHKFSLPYPQSG